MVLFGEPEDPAEPALFADDVLIWLPRLSCRLSVVGEERSEFERIVSVGEERNGFERIVSVGEERNEFERVVSVGVTNGLLLLPSEVQVEPEWKRGPMLRGVKRICDGGGTSCPEPKVTEYVGTLSSDGNANFSESYTFSTLEV